MCDVVIVFCNAGGKLRGLPSTSEMQIFLQGHGLKVPGWVGQVCMTRGMVIARPSVGGKHQLQVGLMCGCGKLHTEV